MITSFCLFCYPFGAGETTIGSSCDCSIVLSGSGVQPHHCTLHRDTNGAVILYAERDSRVLLDGKKIATFAGAGAVSGATPLSQGVMITIGKSNYLRFNHPAEAEMMRSHIGSNERISMPQIDFAQDTSSSGSGSSTDGHSPCDEFLKASSASTAKAAAQNNMNNFHSPKVFTADSVTVNTPAKDVLGANFTNFTKNLTQMFGRNEKNALQQTNGASKKVNNTAITEQKPLNNTTNWPLTDAAALQAQATASSAVVAAAAASPKVPQQFSACYDRYPKPGSYGSLQVFPMNNVNSEMNTEARIVPASGPASLSELQRQRAQIERMQAEEISKQEHDRLDEILKMCADFERQNDITSGGGAVGAVQSSPIVQNRIKTNGSLPREKKNSPATGQPSDIGSPIYYTTPKPRSGYENVQIIGPGRQVQITDSIGAATAAMYCPENFADAVTAASPPKSGGYVPQSPRTKIKTCVSPKRIDPSAATQRAAEYEALVQSFEEKLRLEIQMLRDNRTTVGAVQDGGKTLASNPAAAVSRKPEPVYGTLEKRNKNVNNLTVNIERALDVTAAQAAAERAAEAAAEENQRANAIARLRKERLQLNCERKYLRTCINTLKQQDEHLMREVSKIMNCERIA